MAEKKLPSRVITLTGGGSIATLLFWMALYLAGLVTLLVGAGTLLVTAALLSRGAHSVWTLTERFLISSLMAAQASLLVAAIIRLAPLVAKHVT